MALRRALTIAAMYQRRLCPSAGAILRTSSLETTPLHRTSSRFFHISPQRCEENSNSAPAPGKPAEQRQTRLTRNRTVVSRVLNMPRQVQRPGQLGLDQQQGGQAGNSPNGPSSDVSRRPLIRRVDEGAPSRGPPRGTMVRAPAQLRLSRRAPGQAATGPNLGGRGRPQGAPDRARAGRPGEAGPARRARSAVKASSGPQTQMKEEDMLSDGMVKQLLRLQRKEWDPVKYEPKYTHGSPAALQLLEAGKKLFEGEKPVVKKPGKLERRIGIIGMHGA